jgi:hypothetical protein
LGQAGEAGWTIGRSDRSGDYGPRSIVQDAKPDSSKNQIGQHVDALSRLEDVKSLEMQTIFINAVRLVRNAG